MSALHVKVGFDFEGKIDGEGRIVVPGEVLAHVRGVREGRIHVRLIDLSIARALRANGVTEDEVERIARMQREKREHVVKFLLSESALRPRAMRSGRNRGSRRGTV